MKKKRPSRRKASKPPPERSARGATSRLPGAGRAPAPRAGGHRAPGNFHLLYKVVELSTVDEGALERTLNEWTPKGWNLDGIQFAMREASKRPAMAFVFFTREVPAPAEEAEGAATDGAPQEARPQTELRSHLARLAGDAPAAPLPARVDPYTRLAQLAGLGDEPDDPDGAP